MANRKSNQYERADGANLQQHESTLHVAPGAHSQTVDAGQREQHGGCGCALVPSCAGERAKVRRENDRDRSHAAGLRDQEQSPSVHKCNRRMIRFAEIDILAARSGRQTRGKLGPDEGAAHRQQPAQHPHAKDQ